MADETETLNEIVNSADAPYGQVMFVVFGTAVVLVSLAVALLSVSTTWWMLGVVFAIHLTATAVVCIVIAGALTGRTGRRSTPPLITPVPAADVIEVPAVASLAS